MTKLICCLQFFEDDKPQAMRLARMIADIEMQRRDDVEFMFVRRFDAMQDMETLEYVAQKFLVSSLRTTTQWTGWPGGCNGMALDLLNESMRRVKSGEWADVSGLLMIEPDCVPTSRDWLDRLKREWFEKAEMESKWIMGTWRASGGEYGHINGNCIARPDLAELIDLACITPHLAWDCALAPQLKDRWLETPLIANHFQSKEAGILHFLPAIGETESPALIHGFKDDSAYLLARESMELP